jgi:hypothetical protein
VIISRERTAHKEHSCWRCPEAIAPGSRYIELKLTPNDSDLGNAGWELSRQHEICPPRDPGPCMANGCTKRADHWERCGR